MGRDLDTFFFPRLHFPPFLASCLFFFSPCNDHVLKRWESIDMGRRLRHSASRFFPLFDIAGTELYSQIERKRFYLRVLPTLTCEL